MEVYPWEKRTLSRKSKIRIKKRSQRSVLSVRVTDGDTGNVICWIHVSKIFPLAIVYFL